MVSREDFDGPENGYLTVTWDAAAQRNDWLRLYVDGRRVSHDVATQAEDRLGADKSVRVEVDAAIPAISSTYRVSYTIFPTGDIYVDASFTPGIGAEMIRPETLEYFAELLQPCGFDRRAFLACYGMAECTLGVSFSPLATGFTTHHIDSD